MQICTSLQTNNHASTPPLKFFYRPDALPAAQPTVSKHWRQIYTLHIIRTGRKKRAQRRDDGLGVRYFCNLSNIGDRGQVMLKITLSLTYTRQPRFDGLRKYWMWFGAGGSDEYSANRQRRNVARTICFLLFYFVLDVRTAWLGGENSWPLMKSEVYDKACRHLDLVKRRRCGWVLRNLPASNLHIARLWDSTAFCWTR